MLQVEECKGCRGTVRLSEQETKQIFGDAIKASNAELANEETYKTRLEKCNECSALQYGTTCKYCGCIVQVKAKLLNAKCPYPYEPRW
jgi:hypothetical protein